MEIKIDEWRAAQEKVTAVSVEINWRIVKEDETLAALFAALPSSAVYVPGFGVVSLRGLVPMRLLDGRTELAPEGWKGLRFGKGQPIYELARANFEAWSGGNSFLKAARRSEIGMLARRLVPNFDSYTVEQQWDFLRRTLDKVDGVRRSVGDLANHLENATPTRAKAVPPLKDVDLKVEAAVFSDMLQSTRRAGELLGVPNKDKTRIKHENQTVRKRAQAGRTLLHDYYGKSEYEAIIKRLQRYHRWWAWFDSIEDPAEQMYTLIAEANGTSAAHEQSRAAEDGFAEALEVWVGVVERRLEAADIAMNTDNPGETDSAHQSAEQLWHRQKAIEETDVRFEKALALISLEAPPPSLT